MSQPLARRSMIVGVTTAAATALGAAATTGALAAPAPARGRALIGRAKKHQLHVMTFNIRLERANDTKPGEADHWPDRRTTLIELLKREQPTILGVQEAKYGQLSAVEEALPRHRMIGYGRKGGSKDEYSAIFYDSSRLEVLAWDQFWLSDTPTVIGSATWGNTVTRIVVHARLRDLATGTEFAMINTHFDHESEPARIKSAQAMIDLFQGGQLDGLPTLVTGDFNSHAEDSGAYTTLVTDGPTEDTWLTAQQQLTPAYGTFPNYKEPVDGGPRIDWVLATPDITVRAAAINTSRAKDGRWPSDHVPVQALVELPRA
ncbi:endonuclease/exonuclease/phosphatase family protein [Helcobacillus massiliensis]|uniref:Endonuclease/exonuclease/phosphatase family metal-dependent hydrolase n=1 Tax=Helcobacillus massiliensis TaxID=521392 RepID=A0A839QXJ6_9MICO|nr:endonuclease/exonuclease/phosphatase family protein [Helcobacillus massiliensis]MBB3023550.1 endonuclease/exonuclease/phosphatase family metal-dependent hydrolase [Helcobacillus massiliensis]